MRSQPREVEQKQMLHFFSLIVLTAHTGSRHPPRCHCCGLGSTRLGRPGPAAFLPRPCRWVRDRRAGFPSQLFPQMLFFFCSQSVSFPTLPFFPSLLQESFFLPLLHMLWTGSTGKASCLASPSIPASHRFKYLLREPELWRTSSLISPHLFTYSDSSSLTNL